MKISDLTWTKAPDGAGWEYSCFGTWHVARPAKIESELTWTRRWAYIFDNIPAEGYIRGDEPTVTVEVGPEDGELMAQCILNEWLAGNITDGREPEGQAGSEEGTTVAGT